MGVLLHTWWILIHSILLSGLVNRATLCPAPFLSARGGFLAWGLRILGGIGAGCLGERILGGFRCWRGEGVAIIRSVGSSWDVCGGQVRALCVSSRNNLLGSEGRERTPDGVCESLAVHREMAAWV